MENSDKSKLCAIGTNLVRGNMKNLEVTYESGHWEFLIPIGVKPFGSSIIVGLIVLVR